MSLGANVGKIISANGPALGGLILGYFTSMGMVGTNAFQLAMGAGNGIALNLMLGFGMGVVAPVVPTPFPGVGVLGPGMVY